MECFKIERYNNTVPVYKLKKSYETLEGAIRMAKIINSQDYIIHKVVAYKCKICCKYHIGRNGKELSEKQRIKFKKSRL